MSNLNDRGPQPTIELKHKSGIGFRTFPANGALVSGPLPDGSFQLVFYSDVVEADCEVMSLVAHEGEFATYQPSEIRTANVREDHVRIIASEAALRGMAEAIATRLQAAQKARSAEEQTND